MIEKWYKNKFQQVFCTSEWEHSVDVLQKFEPASNSKSMQGEG